MLRQKTFQLSPCHSLSLLLVTIWLHILASPTQACSILPSSTQWHRKTMLKCSPKFAWCLKVSYAARTPSTAERHHYELESIPEMSAYRFETLYKLERVGLFQFRYRPYRRDISPVSDSVWEGDRWISDTGWLAKRDHNAENLEVLDLFDPEGQCVHRIEPKLFADRQNLGAIIEQEHCFGPDRWMPNFYPFDNIRFQGENLVIRVNSNISEDWDLYKEVSLSLLTETWTTDWEAAHLRKFSELPNVMLSTCLQDMSDASPSLSKHVLEPFLRLIGSFHQLKLAWQHHLTAYSLLNEEASSHESD